jgi:NAD(P)H dehydrogenase (quinone)
MNIPGTTITTRGDMKMNVSVILAHPNKRSFNHAIAGTAVAALNANEHTVFFHDLYAEGFDPILTHAEIPRDAPLDPVISRHCEEIAEADGIVIVHPDWWGQPPAILKGWVDRVIRPGVAYRFLDGDSGEGVPVGLLNANVALVFNTSNTPAERERAIFSDPLENLWKTCIFSFCGVPQFHRRMFSVVVTSQEEERKEWLSLVDSDIRRLF